MLSHYFIVEASSIHVTGDGSVDVSHPVVWLASTSRSTTGPGTKRKA